ncbi:MAG: trypsin-like peptidase domain-containing protein [Fimbriiglobus sp.]
MPIDVVCESCEADFAVPETLAGKTIKCKSCGEGIPVPASGVKKAAPTKPAAPARRSRDEDEDEELPRAKSARKARDEDEDEDDTPRRKPVAAKKSSKLPMILAGLLVLLVVVGAGVGVMFSGILDGDNGKDKDQANNAANNGGGAWVPPDMSQKKAGRGDIAPETTDTKVDDTKPTEEPKTKPKPENTKPDVATSTPGSSGEPKKTLVPVAPEMKKPNPSTTTTTQTGPRTTPDQLAITRVKNAAVYIECESNSHGGSGSGWFGMEENLIFTNAHVMHMLSPGAPKPKKITVWVNPGTNQERVIPHSRLELLTVDRDADLAVIRVLNEKDLPTPLKIRPSAELKDLENLVVVGYPGGRLLSKIGSKSNRAPQATVNQTSFSTNRMDDDGNLYSVQIRGGAGPGNSGGPIIDYDGNVVAVLVRGPSDPTFAASICYGVPTEFVNGLMAGRVSDVEFGQAYRKNGKVHIPVKANVLDPFQRMKEVGIGFWVGDISAKTRPPGQERKGGEPSDADFAKVKLDYKWTKEKQVATGEIVLPELQAGRAYWAQPYFSNALVSEFWMAGKNVKLSGPPVDLEEADLLARYKIGSKRPITILTTSDLEEAELGEGTDASDKILAEKEIKGIESVEKSTDNNAIAALRVNFEKIALKYQLGEEKTDILRKILPPALYAALNQSIKLVQGFAYVKKDGQIYKVLSDLRGAPQFADFFKRFTNDAMETMQSTSISLPSTRCKPGHTWKYEQPVRFTLGFISEPAPATGGGNPPPEGEGAPPAPGGGGGGARGRRAKYFEYKYIEEINYTYLGTRTRNGTKEAVIKLEGTIKPAAGSSAGATGILKGYAYVDLDTGTLLDSELKKEFEMDTSRDGVKLMVSGISTQRVTRGSAQ